MSKRILTVVMALSVGLNVGLLVPDRTGAGKEASPRGPVALPRDPGRLIDDHVRGITQHLDLTEEQQAEIRRVLELRAPDLVRAQQDARRAEERMSRTFGAPRFDPQLFAVEAGLASEARSRVDSLAALMLLEEAAVLTDEQRVRFAEVAATVHSRPRNPSGPPAGDGPRPRRD